MLTDLQRFFTVRRGCLFVRMSSLRFCVTWNMSLLCEIIWHRFDLQHPGAETWSTSRQLARNLDAFQQFCLRRILRISWKARISNEEVRRRTDQPPLTHIIRITRLKFFSHIACVNPSVDCSLALRACVASLQMDWNGQSGRLHHSWLWPLNLIYHHSTLVWQLPIIEHRIVKPGACL